MKMLTLLQVLQSWNTASQHLEIGGAGWNLMGNSKIKLKFFSEQRQATPDTQIQFPNTESTLSIRSCSAKHFDLIFEFPMPFYPTPRIFKLLRRVVATLQHSQSNPEYS